MLPEWMNKDLGDVKGGMLFAWGCAAWEPQLHTPSFSSDQGGMSFVLVTHEHKGARTGIHASGLSFQFPGGLPAREAVVWLAGFSGCCWTGLPGKGWVRSMGQTPTSCSQLCWGLSPMPAQLDCISRGSGLLLSLKIPLPPVLPPLTSQMRDVLPAPAAEGRERCWDQLRAQGEVEAGTGSYCISSHFISPSS